MTKPNVKTVLTKAYNEQLDMLNERKQESVAWGKDKDWPWNGMILSAATRGGSKRWAKVKLRYPAELAWDIVIALSDKDRRELLMTVGRFPTRTADWLEGVFHNIQEAGGPSGVRAKLATMDAAGVIEFWTAFPGMGPKYARNIMMDVYDPRFQHVYFAIDSRIAGLLPLLGYTGQNKYEEQEKFLNGLASEMSVDAWDLDRLLYQRASDLTKALKDE